MLNTKIHENQPAGSGEDVKPTLHISPVGLVGGLYFKHFVDAMVSLFWINVS